MGNPAMENWGHATEAETSEDRRHRAFELVEAEIVRAYGLHGNPRWGRHEAWAIIKEELDEVWDAVKKDLPMDDLQKELVQVAAMCIRYLETEPGFGLYGRGE